MPGGTDYRQFWCVVVSLVKMCDVTGAYSLYWSDPSKFYISIGNQEEKE